MTVRYSVKDLVSGAIFVLLGLAFGYAAYAYPLGTALRMGPGYFPLILAGILVLLGATIFVQSFAKGADEIPLSEFPWLGIALVTASLVFFGMTVRGLGLAPSLFVTVTMAAYASRRTGIIGALLISAGLTALCMLIFIWALGLPLPMVGRWLAF